MEKPALRSFARRLALPVLASAMSLTLLAGCGSGISLDEPIEGPAWRLTQLGDEPLAPGSDAQLSFDRSSGRVSGSGGCNRVTGAYTRSGVSLKIGQLAATRMACGDPVRAASEAQFLAALNSTTSYRLVGPGRMALLDASGRTVASLSAAR